MPRGQPKKFSSAKQLIDLWQDFNEDIRNNDFIVVPNQSNFCRYLKTRFKEMDRRTIYNSLNKYFPDIKANFEQIQADTIAEGAMLGHYQSTMSIFALKNWCKWSDNNQVAVVAKSETIDPLSKSLKTLAEELENDK